MNGKPKTYSYGTYCGVSQHYLDPHGEWIHRNEYNGDVAEHAAQVERAADLLANIADNLSDMPISDAWARQTCQRIEPFLEECSPTYREMNRSLLEHRKHVEGMFETARTSANQAQDKKAKYQKTEDPGHGAEDDDTGRDQHPEDPLRVDEPETMRCILCRDGLAELQTGPRTFTFHEGQITVEQYRDFHCRTCDQRYHRLDLEFRNDLQIEILRRENLQRQNAKLRERLKQASDRIGDLLDPDDHSEKEARKFLDLPDP